MMPDFAAVLRLSHIFAAPRARVWEAWTKPELLSRWFGPKGCETILIEHDLRVGGAWRSRMEMDGAPPMYGKFVFREVDPPSRLVWVHGFADEQGNRVRAPFPGVWPMEMLTIVTFADDGGGTRVTLEFAPIESTPEERATFIANLGSMNDGWSDSFAQLEGLLR